MTDAQGVTRHLAAGGGKDGHIYIVDRDNMGKFNAASNANVYQDLPGATAHGMWSTPRLFQRHALCRGPMVNVEGFRFNNARC